MMDQKLLQVLDLCNLYRNHQAAVFALSGLHLCLRHQIHHEISRYLLSCFTTKFLSWLIYNLLLDLFFLKDRFPITLILWVIKLMIKPICLQVPRSDQVQRHCLDCTWTKIRAIFSQCPQPESPPARYIRPCWAAGTAQWHSVTPACSECFPGCFGAQNMFIKFQNGQSLWSLWGIMDKHITT